MRAPTPLRPALRLMYFLMAGFFSLTLLSGCLVAGVSSSGGAFVWPGGLGLIVVVLLVVFLLLRRR